MTRDELKTFLAPLPDDAILGLTLYGEARGEPIEGIVAVGHVILNRAKDVKKRWPGNARQVCLQKSQFSCWMPEGGQANHEAVLAAAQSMLLKEPADRLLEQCAWVALGIARFALLDNSKGSNHYHTAALHPRPAWASSFVPVTQKGGHVFYRL